MGSFLVRIGDQMAICGVEIGGKEIRLAVVSVSGQGKVILHKIENKKIIMSDERNTESVQTFQKAIRAFARENSIEEFVLKDRARTGTYSGGAVSFKIEAILQLVEECKVSFVNPSTLARFVMDAEDLPDGMVKYLDSAFRCGAYRLIRG
jgi:hypothetical protein